MTRRLALILSLVFGCISASAIVRIDGDTVVCLGQWPIILSAATGLTNYSWSTGQNTVSIAISGPGTYRVTAYRAGVLDSGSITVREATPPFPDLPNDVVYICTGDFITHQVRDEFVSYLWSTGDRTHTVRIDTAGWYKLTVTDANGCSGSDSMQVLMVSRPKPQIAGPVTVCNGALALYDTDPIPGATYLWNVIGGVLESGQGQPLVKIRWPGGSGSVELRVTVRRPDGGMCDTLVRMPVRVGPRLEPYITHSKLNFCEGDSTVLDAGGGFSVYRWSNGATTRTIVVKSAGTYSAEVTDATGCMGSTDVVTVGVYPPPDVRILGDTSMCPGQTVTLTGLAVGNNVVQWLWSNGLAQKTIFVSTPGTYTLIGRTANGCIDTARFTIVSAAMAAVDAPDSLDLDSLELSSTIFMPFVLVNKTNAVITVVSARLASGRNNPRLSVPAIPNTIPAFGDLAFLLSWFTDAEGPFADTLVIEVDGPKCPSTIRIPIKGYRFNRPIVPNIPIAISIGDAFVPVGTIVDMPIQISIAAQREELVALEFSVRWIDRVFHVTDLAAITAGSNVAIVSDVTVGGERIVRFRLDPLRIPVDTSLTLRGTVILGSPTETDLTPQDVVATSLTTSLFNYTTEPGHIASSACYIDGRLALFTDAQPLTVITNLLGEVVTSDIASLPSGRYMITTITGTTMHTRCVSIVR